MPLRSPCGHIFCRPCAERRFSSTNTCSLCDAALDLESELVELTHERSAEAGLATFALCATFPEEAWRIFVEASMFCRTQTALYGTREIWIRAKETEVGPQVPSPPCAFTAWKRRCPYPPSGAGNKNPPRQGGEQLERRLCERRSLRRCASPLAAVQCPPTLTASTRAQDERSW